MMYRLIVSDLDGTLLRDDHTLSEYTKEVIRQVSEKGIEFILATGRIYGGAKKYARQLNLNTPILACNGALIKEADGKLVYGNPLSASALEEVFRLLTEKGLYFHCYGEESFFTKQIPGSLASFYAFDKGVPEEDKFPLIEIEPMKLVGKETIYKVLARCEGEENRKELYDCLMLIPGISVTVSWHNSFDICASEVSKASAIDRYAAKNGIQPSEIICFGDNYNDIDMIRYAGLGITLENGVDAIKAAADHVTAGNNDDGVAKAIEKFIFGK